jgi:site-specific recombinase XerD
MGEAEELIVKFEDDLITAGQAKNTRSTYVGAVRQFSKFMNGNLLNVTKNDLRAYLNTFREQDRRKSTVKFHFTALSEFYECMVEDEIMSANPITASFRERYLRQYKAASGTRYSPTTEEVKRLVGSIINTRDLAIIIIAFKCALRRNEIRSLDITSVNMEKRELLLTPTPKRTNLRVFFDDECAQCIERWIKRRGAVNANNSSALFLSRNGERMSPQSIDDAFRKYARAAGFTGTRIEEKLTIHCARHWNGSALYKAGMRTEFIEFLRGDKGKTSFSSTYLHLDLEQVKAEYERCIPSLLI